MSAPANHLAGTTESQQIHSTQLSSGQALSRDRGQERNDDPRGQARGAAPLAGGLGGRARRPWPSACLRNRGPALMSKGKSETSSSAERRRERGKGKAAARAL